LFIKMSTRAEGIEGGREHPFHLILIAVVALHHDCPPTLLLHLRACVVCALLVVEVVHHHIGTLTRELHRCGLPDPGVRPG
jgi:hypothetical protein